MVRPDVNRPVTYTVLGGGTWIEVRKANGWYEYMHSLRSDGRGVAILPFRWNPVLKHSLGHVYQFLARYEVTLSHGSDIQMCSITGMVDKSDKTIEQIVLEELKEEGGYLATDPSVLINLGTVRPNKGSDGIQYLFAINIDDPSVMPCVAEGDGTFGEVGAYCDWISLDQLSSCKDPLMHAMFLRFTQGFQTTH